MFIHTNGSHISWQYPPLHSAEVNAELFCVNRKNTFTWWRQMGTFSTLLALCVGNSPVTGEFPAQRPVTRSFDVFFDLHLNKQLSKQLKHWWFEMPLCLLWRHYNMFCFVLNIKTYIYVFYHFCWDWDEGQLKSFLMEKRMCLFYTANFMAAEVISKHGIDLPSNL